MKRPFMILAVAAVLALGAWAVLRGRWGAAPSAADGPIILISIDTLRADHLPAYGYTHVRTPNIDALASEAAVFEQAYSHSPQTLPAHTSILSGQLPFDHGVRDNIGFTVKPGQWFIQRALHERGWPTGGFVSAYVLRSATGINQGFDTFDSDLPPASRELSIGQVQRDGVADARCSREMAWRPGRQAILPLPSLLRAAQALRAAGPLCAVRAVRRRNRLRRRARRPPVRSPACGKALRSRDDRPARRSRRRARRSWRAGTRHVPLPRDDARPADGEAARPSPGAPGRGAGAAHRPRADYPRPRRRCRRVASCTADRCARCSTAPARCPTRASTPKRSTRATTSAGASCTR